MQELDLSKEFTLTINKIDTVVDIGGGYSILRLNFNSNVEGVESAYYQGKLSEAVTYQDEECLFSFRYDILEGEEELFVAHITQLNNVHVVKAEGEIKLFGDKLLDNNSNINFRDFNIGDVAYNAVVYCHRSEMKASTKGFGSVWREFIISDSQKHFSKLRVFGSGGTRNEDISQCYITGDMLYNEYGWKSDDIQVIEGLVYNPSSEIEISLYTIKECVKDDELLNNIVNNTQFIDKLRIYNIRENMEKGSEAVRLAMHMVLAKQSQNLTKELKLSEIYRCLIASRLFVLSDRNDHPYSRDFQNILRATEVGLGKDKEVMKFLDVSRDDKTDIQRLIEHQDNLVSYYMELGRVM